MFGYRISFSIFVRQLKSATSKQSVKIRSWNEKDPFLVSCKFARSQLFKNTTAVQIEHTIRFDSV